MDVTIEPDAEGRIIVKLQADAWEVNVWGAKAELAQLAEIRSADWEGRRSLAAGESAGAQVWWHAAATKRPCS